jgi:hypothetical protein
VSTGAWPNDPNGSLVPILEASLEASVARHPSASGDTPGDVLTAADRCDRCNAAAGYRVRSGVTTTVLDFCVHHWRRYFPAMAENGWVVVGANPDISAMVQESGPSTSDV